MPHTSPRFLSASRCQRAREAKPSTQQEVEQRAAGMVNVLAEWTEMMFPRDKSRAEVQEVLFGVAAD
jgi:hypothetical protein